MEEVDTFKYLLMPWMNRISKYFGAVVKEKLREAKIDLNKEQIIILKYLSQSDGMFQYELAHITERDKTTLTRLIKKLEAKGYVKRKTCEEDSRCKKVFITESGLAMYNTGYTLLQNIAEEIQSDLSDIEIEEAMIIFNKITNKAKQIYDEEK